MNNVKLNKTNIIDLKLNEDYIQQYISNDPSVIGLGNLEFVERERIQSSGGRLDLLLRDPDTNKRFEVEVQLRGTDPSHIIRTLEYWDVERKRYPQYEHCAVIIAEDITNRFFNVISLFNGFIPIVAIQMNAYKIADEGKYGLVFTKILDQSSLLSSVEEPRQEPTDENWWKSRFPNTLKYAKVIISLVNEEKQDGYKYELNYVKSYIGLKSNNKVSNIISFSGRKDSFVVVNVHLSENEESTALLKEKGVTTLSYDAGFRNYRLKFSEEDLESESVKEVIKNMFAKAEKEYYE